MLRFLLGYGMALFLTGMMEPAVAEGGAAMKKESPERSLYIDELSNHGTAAAYDEALAAAILDSLALFRQEHPEVPLEVVDPYNFFALFKRHAQQP